MPEAVSVTENRNPCRATASPKFSVALVQIDLKRDAISLLLELLKGICADFSTLSRKLDPPTSDPSSNLTETSNNATRSSVSPHHLIVGRLNSLVCISKRVLIAVQKCDVLYSILLRAVFYVVRLTLWSSNRSVRCAALRCLRYYLHSSTDVHLFLSAHLDIMVVRCLDLSYLPEPPNQFLRQATQNSNETDSAGFSDQATSKSRSMWRGRSAIYPRLSRLHVSSPTSKVASEVSSPSSAVNSGNIPTSPLVTGFGERKLFIRLAYHLLRLAPHLFSRSLLQAISAPCLHAGRLQVCGEPESKNDPRPPAPMAGRYPDVSVGNREKVTNTSFQIVDKQHPLTRDATVRGCLLIIAELIIFSPDRVLDLLPQSSSAKSELSCPDDLSLPASSRDSPSSVAVQALLTAFSALPNSNTLHPSPILDAVLSALLTLVNSTKTIALLPVRCVSKFFVPFTSMLEKSSEPKLSSYDDHPSFSACAKSCLIRALRSWAGLFYFLDEGRTCLQTLMYSLAVGTTTMRDHILDLLFGLFPVLPKPHSSVKHMEPAIHGLIEALLVGSSCLPPNSSVPNCKSAPTDTRRSPPSSCSWNFEQGFVASEGCRLFAAYNTASGSTVDLVTIYMALLLAILIEAGLYEALVRAVSDVSESTSARAGLLLGLLAYKASTLLPQQHPAARRLHSVRLLQVDGSQQAIVWLERVHRVMHSHDVRRVDSFSLIRIPLHSPFLECLARQTKCVSRHPNDLPSVKTAQISEAWVDQIVTQSVVVPDPPVKHSFFCSRPSPSPIISTFKDPEQWDWPFLASFGRSLFDVHSMISWEDRSRLMFLRRLMQFLTPTSSECLTEPAHSPVFTGVKSVGLPASISRLIPIGSSSSKSRESAMSTAMSSTKSNPVFGTETTCLCWLPHTWPYRAYAAILYSGLIPHLAIYPSSSEPGQLLLRFLSSIRAALEALWNSSGHDASVRLFDGKQLSDSCSPIYLLILGRLTSIDEGESHLESSGLCSIFHRFLLTRPKCANSGLDCESLHLILKILLSSLDFRRPGRFSFQLLNAAVNGAPKSVRLYLVKFIQLLFRLNIPLMASWGVDLVVKLSMDVSPLIASSSLHLLEEICWDTVNVEALTHHILLNAKQGSGSAQTFAELLTPFGLRLLQTRTGGLIGHRVMASVLSRGVSFESLASRFPHNKFVNRSLNVSTLSERYMEDLSVDSLRTYRLLLEWILNSSRANFNLAYALEVDRRMSSVFCGRSFWCNASNQPVNDLPFGGLFVGTDDAFSGKVDRSTFPLTAPDNVAEDDLWDLCDDDDVCLKQAGHAAVACSEYSKAYLIPKHLYGCFAEHPAGLELLMRHGLLRDAVETLESACKLSSLSVGMADGLTSGALGTRTSNSLTVDDAKAALWAIAHVGASGCGQSWMSGQPDLVETIRQIAVNAESIGLRATAWLCLNLITSRPGGEKLVAVIPATGPQAFATQTVWVADGLDSTNVPLSCSSVNDFPNGRSMSPSVAAPSELNSNHLESNSQGPTSGLVTGSHKHGTNGLKSRKGFALHGSSLSSTRRFLSRRLSSRPKHDVRAVPLKPLDSNHCLTPKDSDTRRSSTPYTADVNGSSYLVDCATLGSIHDPNNSSSHPRLSNASIPIYSSVTWTYTDFLSYKKSILEMSSAKSSTSTDGMELATNAAPLGCSKPPVFRGLCLPADLRVLGSRAIRLSSTVSDLCSPSKLQFCKPEHPSHTKSLLSFVQIASDAMCLIDRCEQRHHLTSNNAIPKQNVSRYPFTSDDSLDQETSEPTGVASLSNPRLSSVPLEISFSSEKRNDPVFPSDQNGLTDFNDLPTNTVSRNNCEIRNRPNVHSSSPRPHECLYRNCKSNLSSRDHNGDTVDYYTSLRDQWCEQLLHVATGLLACMSSVVHDLALRRLVRIAHQRWIQYCSRTPSNRWSPAGQMLNACVFTQLSRLLATYTFPLESRVKIQAALSGLPLLELFLDAQDAVCELSVALQSESIDCPIGHTCRNRAPQPHPDEQ